MTIKREPTPAQLDLLDRIGEAIDGETFADAVAALTSMLSALIADHAPSIPSGQSLVRRLGKQVQQDIATHHRSARPRGH